MITEKRFKRIAGDRQISGGVYTNEKGVVICQSRYERKLNWFEKLINKLSQNWSNTIK